MAVIALVYELGVLVFFHVIPLAVVVLYRCFTFTFSFSFRTASTLHPLLGLLVLFPRLNRFLELPTRGKFARGLCRFPHGEEMGVPSPP